MLMVRQEPFKHVPVHLNARARQVGHDVDVQLVTGVFEQRDTAHEGRVIASPVDLRQYVVVRVLHTNLHASATVVA